MTLLSPRKVLARPVPAIAVHGGHMADLSAGSEYDVYAGPDESGQVRIVTLTPEKDRVWLNFWRVAERDLTAATTDHEAER